VNSQANNKVFAPSGVVRFGIVAAPGRRVQRSLRARMVLRPLACGLPGSIRCRRDPMLGCLRNAHGAVALSH